MTDLATIARQNAVECIKVGYRQGKEGHILSLAMNPHDVPDAVATASLGSRWMVALVQISDDEQPQGQDNSGSAPSPSLADAADSPAAAPKPKKHWADYSPSQQAWMMCCNRDFAIWLANRMDFPTVTAGDDDEVAERLRRELAINSRSDLDTNPEAAKRWRELHSMFTADTQYGDRR